LVIIVGISVGAGGGFLVGMRTNKKFNKYVRQSTIGRRMSMSSNALLKNTLSLTDFGDINFGDDYGDDNDDYGHYGSTGEQVPLRKH
jgi:hypothetical protein